MVVDEDPEGADIDWEAGWRLALWNEQKKVSQKRFWEGPFRKEKNKD